MRHFAGLLTGLLLILAGGAQAEGKAGSFDYYVLSLGWSSTWCDLTGDARGDAQCRSGRGLTFTLHGLWPQYESGYPDNCFSDQPDASKLQTQAMADVMGGAGLAWHEWKKHGRCSGLSAADYFAAARQAYASVTIPPLFAKVHKDLTLPASVIQDAFLESNPSLTADILTVTCADGKIDEVRICLDKTLTPRPCGADVARDCSLKAAELPPVR
jgi:ribonuclease T2